MRKRFVHPEVLPPWIVAVWLLMLGAGVAVTLAARAGEPEFRQEFPLDREPAEPGEETTELEPITVYAPAEPLDHSQRLLRVLLARSAPCLGCDAATLRAPRPSRAVLLLQYLLMPAVPPEPDEWLRLAVHEKLRDSPDLEYLEP